MVFIEPDVSPMDKNLIHAVIAFSSREFLIKIRSVFLEAEQFEAPIWKAYIFQHRIVLDTWVSNHLQPWYFFTLLFFWISLHSIALTNALPPHTCQALYLNLLCCFLTFLGPKSSTFEIAKVQPWKGWKKTSGKSDPGWSPNENSENPGGKPGTWRVIPLKYITRWAPFQL